MAAGLLKTQSDDGDRLFAELLKLLAERAETYPVAAELMRKAREDLYTVSLYWERSSQILAEIPAPQRIDAAGEPSPIAKRLERFIGTIEQRFKALEDGVAERLGVLGDRVERGSSAEADEG